MTAIGRLVAAHLGPASLSALRTLVAEAQDGDALAPVDVVVPTALAGVTLRREIAGADGLANVRFGSLPQLAERLAARHLALGGGHVRRPLTSLARKHAVRSALAAAPAPPGSLAAAARHRATAGMLESVMAELDSADIAGAAEDALSPRGRELLHLHAAYRSRLQHHATPSDMLDLAVEALTGGEAPDTHVVLLGTGRFARRERALLGALRAAGRLSAVLCTEPEPVDDSATWLADLFGSGAQRSVAAEPGDLELLVAPDPEEEVRIAVRTALAHLAAHPRRPERIGIAYRSSTPYTRLLAEQLQVAGVPHHVPRQRTLAQSVAGRSVLGLLELHRRRYPRADVLAWLADAPVLDAAGSRVPAARWDRVSREAGVSRGLSTWRDRLERHGAESDRRAEAVDGDAVDAQRRRDRHHRDAAAARALLSQVEDVAAHAEAVVTAPTWFSAADSLVALLRRCLGSRRTVDCWASEPDSLGSAGVVLEQQAYDSVELALQALRELDGVAGVPDVDSVLDAVRDALDTTVPSGTTLGRGVVVAPIGQFVGADLDLLLVLGMTEDSFPPRQREHPVLRDGDRKALSPELPTVRTRRDDERAHWMAALCTAPRIVLSYPRADTRSQRRQFPSPWYLEQARRLAGRPVGAGEVDAATSATLDATWFTSLASFVQALERAPAYASVHELDVALAQAGQVDALAAQDVRLQRGLESARARGRGEFGAWSGNVGPLPEELRVQVDGHLSASTLQEWATCPAGHFYGHVLGVRALEDRASEDTIDARDKGSLVHDVLESFFREHLGDVGAPGRSPDSAWTVAEIEQAQQVLDERAAELQRRGLTGRPVLWSAQLAQLRRALARVLSVDSALRRERRAWPVSVEASFGRDGVPELVVDLPTQGAVPFAGKIDRIDATERGGLVVLDYKTGRGYGYDAIPTLARPDPEADMVDRGRRLQLLLYALAARQLEGMPDAQTEAYFWFVELGNLHRGATIGEPQEQRLREVLDVVVGGIRDGVYPANPGGETWRPGQPQSWDACTYCPFDRVCSTTRAEQWREQRTDPRVQAYASLAEPGTEAS